MHPADRPGEILVTGAAGFIGSHLVRALRGAGWAVAALDIREIPGDVSDLGRPIRAGADDPGVRRDVAAGRYAAVVHQAAITSTLETDWERLSEVNTRQPMALAGACAASGTTFVYASSHSVYGRINGLVAVAEGAEHDRGVCSGPLNLYARSKLELDDAMAAPASGPRPPWVGLRYTNVFGTGESHKGPMASIISQILKKAACGAPVSLFADTLQAARDYIPVAAVADTVISLLDQPVPSGVYNLGSGCPVSFATLLEWCQEFSGTPPDVRLEPNPIPARYQYWTCADMTRIQRHLPGFNRAGTEDVKAAAERLFQRFSASVAAVSDPSA